MRSAIGDLETQRRSEHKILVGKSGVKWSLWKLKPIREENIKMALIDIWYTCVDWFHVDPDMDQWWTLVNLVMNLRLHRRGGISWTAEQLQLNEICRNTLKAETIRLSNYWPLKWTCGRSGTEDAASRVADKSGLLTEIWAVPVRGTAGGRLGDMLDAVVADSSFQSLEPVRTAIAINSTNINAKC
jgi:hypothetical protein